MIKKDIIQKLFLQETEIITTHELNEMGFKNHDIAKLVKNGVLSRNKIGQYSISLDKIKEIQSDVTISSDIRLACARYIVRIEPTNKKALMYILVASIRVDLNEVMRITDILFKIEHNAKDHTNYLVTLKLLSTLIDLPENYKNLVAELNAKDLFLTREEYDYCFEFNQVINLIWKGLFLEANRLAYKYYLLDKENVLSIVNRLLLKENVEKHSHDFVRLCNQVLEGDYNAAIDKLNNSGSVLSDAQKALLILSRAMKELNEKGMIPRNRQSNKNDLFGCIIEGDFDKAISFHNIPKDNLKYVKIKEILDQFAKMKQEEIPLESELKYSELRGTFADIIYLLQNGSYKPALEKFVETIGNTDDEFLHKIYLLGLMLFRNLINLPENLEQLLYITTIEDVCMDENDKVVHSTINGWIRYIYDGIYKNELYNPFKNRYMAHFNELFKALLRANVQKEIEFDKKLKDSYRALDYDSIIKLLEKKKAEAQIVPIEKLILNLALTNREMQKNKKVPIKKKAEGTYYVDYLQANDFVSARNHIKPADGLQKEYTVLCSMLDDAIALEETISLIGNHPHDIITKAVQAKDYNLAMNTIDKMYGKGTPPNVEMKCFVSFMMITKEPDYLKLNIILNDISKGEPLNKLNYFRNVLKSAISNHRFIEVELLARFIGSSNSEIAKRLRIEEILKANEQDKEFAGYKSVDALNIVSELIEASHISGYDLYYLANSYNPKPINIEKIASDVLTSRSIGVVGPISEKEFQRLAFFVRSRYDNIVVFHIAAHRNRIFIGLKYQEIKGPFIPVSDYKRKADEAMLAKDYNTAKDIYLKLLGLFQVPQAYVYKQLAKISQIEGDFEKAINYFYFAAQYYITTENYKEAKRLFGIINKIKYQVYVEQKNNEDMRKEENQTSKEYETFADILYANWSKETLRDLIKKMRLDEEEVKIIKLLVAKRCLNNDKGKEAKNIINGVKHSKNNSPKVLSLIEELEGVDLNSIVNTLNARGFIIKPKNTPKKDK